MSDVKTKYNEVQTFLAAKAAEWQKTYNQAKTRETMAAAWLYVFANAAENRIRPARLIGYAVASIQYKAGENLDDLLKYMKDCGGTNMKTNDVADFYRSIHSAVNLELIGRWRDCLVQFVSNLFTDPYRAGPIRDALRLFRRMTEDTTIGDYAISDRIPTNIHWQLQQTYGEKRFGSKLKSCLRRAVARQPNWKIHGLEGLYNTWPDGETRNRFIKFWQSPAGNQQKQEIDRLVQQCLFPELFGPPPNDFFDDYVLDQRTGNYIPFDQVNIGIQSIDGNNIDAKTAAAPMQDIDTASAAAAAFPASTSFTASAAAAAKKGGMSARMYPFSVRSLF